MRFIPNKVGWNFPANDNGPEAGLNDSGIETFKDSPLASLARECLQNSVDAHDGSKKPVEVHFQRLERPSAELPGCTELTKALKLCLKRWSASAPTAAFLENALAALQKLWVPVLKISDYNTTGLTVAGGADSDWHKITKMMGSPDKSEGKLGSFGIGKNAPFASSELRTVFYGTKDRSGASAFQGVAKLPTHVREKGIRTQGIGYYGIRRNNEPCAGFDGLPSNFGRTKVGADIYIAGFCEDAKWEQRIAKAVIESFFAAIHQGNLMVRVGKTALNKGSLAEQIKKHYQKSEPGYFADAYYAALVSDEAQVFTDEDFCGHGKIELRLLEEKEFKKKKVAMFRHSGMKIFDKGNFQTTVPFAGVFKVEDTGLDALLRRLENPAHDDWKPERGTPEARRVRRELFRWLNERVGELGAAGQADEVDAEGVSQFLPDDGSERSREPELEALHSEPAETIEVMPRKSSRVKTPLPEPEQANAGGEDDDGDGEVEDPQQGQGQGGDGSLKHAMGEGGGAKEEQSRRRVEIENRRIFCTDAAAERYRIFFEARQSGPVYLKLFAVGEVGAEPAPVVRWSAVGSAEQLAQKQQGLLGPFSVEKGKRMQVDVVLNAGTMCALEVYAYGD